MADQARTPPSLVDRLRDRRDREAWTRFVELYGPMVYRYGRRRGLQDFDAADLTQAVFGAVIDAIQRFEHDPARAKFRTWLFRITRNQYTKLMRARASDAQAKGGSSAQEFLNGQHDRDETDAWEREYRRSRFQWAAERARQAFEPKTFAAFWRTAVENQPAEAVARELGFSAGQVYTYKSRVLDRIRREIERLEDD